MYAKIMKEEIKENKFYIGSILEESTSNF